MRRIWDAIAFMLVTMFVFYMILDAIQPFIPLFVFSAIALVAARVLMNGYRNW